MVKHQEDELQRKADEEEHVELHDAYENLVMREHPFDLSICPEALVDLPSEFSPYLPAESNVRDFRYGDHDRDDGGENVDGDA